MNRREMILGTGSAAIAALSGFNLPKPASGCTLWLVLYGGSCNHAEGLAETKANTRQARKLGFETLDTIHTTDQCSRVLARKRMPLREAERIERETIAENQGSRDLDGLVLKAMWIEVVK